jgi:hypothetical protein
VAATVRIKPVEVSGFASYHPRDATINSFDTTGSVVETITSLSTSGYHRTGAELSKRNTLTELVCGGNASFSMAPGQQVGFKIGLTGIYYRYSASLSPKIYTYNQFGFRGRDNANTGIDVQLRYHGIYFFGEAGRSLNTGTAWLAGVFFAPDPVIGITLICRNYGTGYQDLFSNAFGQNSLNSNEKGIYTAVNAAIHPKVTVSGYIDIFSFPWLKYRVDSPVRGLEFGTMLGWQASRDMMISLRLYQKNTRMNGSAAPGQNMHTLTDFLCRSYRFSMEWSASAGIHLKTRVEVKETGVPDAAHQTGYLVYQEAQVKISRWVEALHLRITLFDIPAYESRIYVYEPEVLYGYSVPAYQGQGMHSSLVTKIAVSRHLDLWIRGAITCYTDRQTVGTGNDMTEGNVRGELTGQVLVRF